MFASIRKFQINPKAAPIDDIESLFYLVAFCLDGFYLPWLQDYINQDSTEQFIYNRLKKASKSHQYLYEQMPRELAKGLRYLHRMSEKINSNEINASGGSGQRDTQIDTDFLRECFSKMHADATKRSEMQANMMTQNQGSNLTSNSSSEEDQTPVLVKVKG